MATGLEAFTLRIASKAVVPHLLDKETLIFLNFSNA